MPKKVFILAGEASGDLQGAFLVKELKKLRGDIEFAGIGGRLLKEEGVDVICDTTCLGVVGPWNAILKLPFLFWKVEELKRWLLDYRPDLLVMIDSPALNMRMGKFARAHGIETLYYFPPSAWYRNSERAAKISAVSSYLVPVFDYQVKTFEEAGVPFRHFGHPILDVVAEKLRTMGGLDLPEGRKIVAFLPGSRPQEVNSLMKVYIRTMRAMLLKRSDLFFLIPASSPDMKALIERYMAPCSDIPFRIVEGGSYLALSHASAAVTASGTATLEASVLGVPMTVVYKLAWPDWILGKLIMIKVPMFALPNLVLQKKSVPELLQTEVNPERIMDEVFRVLDDSPERTKMLETLAAIKRSLGEEGAVRRIAEYLNDILKD